MPRAVIIFKIDPAKRLIARMPIIPSTKGVRSIIGCSQIGHRRLMDAPNGEMLLVAARVEQPRDNNHPEWRLRGTDNTVGVGILFGTLNRKLDGMWHCPVDLEWIQREIVWCEPGEVASADEVAKLLGLGDAQPAEE